MPAADQLFRRDARWRGGDGAYSVHLGGDATLWLFGDSFVGRSPGAPRSEATMIHNSVALQRGRDPRRASLRFHWRRAAGGAAQDFFAAQGEEYFWPGGAALVGTRLVVFLMRVRSTRQASGQDTPADLGFRVVGSAARIVANPDDPPHRWRMRALDFADNPWGVKVGVGCALVHGAHLYAYSVHEPGTHDVYLLRWPRADAAAGRLARPEWWVGDGWSVSPDAGRPPRPVLPRGQTELAVFRDPDAAQLVEVQVIGFPGHALGYRTAPRPEGPWSPLVPFFAPQERARPDVLVYAAKAHPQLRFGAAAGVVVTYMTNSVRFAELLRDARLYYPRFVALRRPPAGR